MKNRKYIFEVETIESGQRHSYGDSFYTYKVTSSCDEHEVKAFCMNVLKDSSIKSKMPNPFAGELLEFKNMTENNKGKSFFDQRSDDTFSYKVRCEYTD